MNFFIEYENDPGFEVGQSLRMNDQHWVIIGIRDNGKGLWLNCK